MGEIDRRSPVPLYYQLAQILRDQIRNGAFRAAAGIPSERELQEAYKVSRNTVRKAMDLLVSEDIVRREHGRGAYVLPESLSIRCRIDAVYEHFQTIREIGYIPSFQLISSTRCKPDAPVREALGLGQDAETFCVVKLFFADDQPAILSEDYIPAESLIPPYDIASSGEGFFAFLEEHADARIEFLLSDIIPVVATGEIAKHFACPEGSPLLLLRELYLDSSQKIAIQFAHNYFNPEIIQYRVLRRRRQT